MYDNYSKQKFLFVYRYHSTSEKVNELWIKVLKYKNNKFFDIQEQKNLGEKEYSEINNLCLNQCKSKILPMYLEKNS